MLLQCPALPIEENTHCEEYMLALPMGKILLQVN